MPLTRYGPSGALALNPRSTHAQSCPMPFRRGADPLKPASVCVTAQS